MPSHRPASSTDPDSVTAEIALAEYDQRLQEAQRAPGEATEAAYGSLQAVVRFLHCVERIKSQSVELQPDNIGRPLPERIGKFLIRRKLGCGGYGVVYLAHDPTSDRDVALKVPTSAALDHAELRERFLREVRSTARLEHPNIVQLLEAGEVDGLPYIAMTYCGGPTLADWLAQLSELPPIRLAAEIVRDLAYGLDHAHRAGVLHRDIKPGNVLWSNQRIPNTDYAGAPGRSAELQAVAKPRLADFGLARLTEDSGRLTKSRARVGTWRYMSPEQASGNARQIGPAADIHALGVILYELLTGLPPFVGNDEVETCMLIARTEPVSPHVHRPNIHRDLNLIVMKCLEKRPQDRYETAGDLAADLTRFLVGEPIVARPAGVGRRTVRMVRRHPLASTALTLVATALLAVGWLQAKFNRDLDVASKKIDLAETERAHERRAARVFSYSTDMRRAYVAWDNCQLKNTEELLDRLRPEAGAEDLRGFDWHFLRRMSRGTSKSWESHHGKVLALAFAPGRPLLASSGADGCVRIWSAASGQLVRELSGHAKCDVDGLAISPDGKWLCSGGSDNLAIIWDFETGAVHRRLVGHTGWIAYVCFAPDSQSVVTAGDKRLLQWDVATGKLLRVFASFKDQVRGLDIDPKGRMLGVSCEDKGVWLHDFTSGMPLHSAPLKIPGEWSGFVRCLHFEPDSTSLQGSCQSDMFIIWETRRKQFGQVRYHDDQFPARQFAIDGRIRFVLGVCNDKAVHSHGYGRDGLEQVSKIRIHRNVADALALNRDSSLAATGDRDGAIHVFDPKASPFGSTVSTDKSMRSHRSPIVDAARQRAVAFGEVGYVVCDLPKSRDRKAGNVRVTAEIVDAVWTGSDSLALMYTDRIAHVVASSGKVLQETAMQFKNTDRLLQSTGDLAWTAGPDAVNLIDLNRREVRFRIPKSRDNMFAQVSVDGKRLAVSPRLGVVEIWDLVHRRLVREFMGHSHSIRNADFSDNGLLVTGDDVGEIKLWDIEKGAYLGPFIGPDSTILSVGFLGEDRNLAAFDSKRWLWIWRLDTAALVAQLALPNHISATLHSRSNGIIIASESRNETMLTVMDGAP